MQNKRFLWETLNSVFKRVCAIGSFCVISLNCSKCSLLIGRFKIISFVTEVPIIQKPWFLHDRDLRHERVKKWTWWMRLVLANSLQVLQYVWLKASETNIVFPDEHFKSNSHFSKRRKNVLIHSGLWLFKCS